MSSESDQTGNAQSFPEETVRRVLARASELDAARSNELTLADLQAVAREAGITPSALDQALAEINTHAVQKPVEAAPPVEIKGWHRLRPLAIGALVTLGVIGTLLVFFGVMRTMP